MEEPAMWRSQPHGGASHVERPAYPLTQAPHVNWETYPDWHTNDSVTRRDYRPNRQYPKVRAISMDDMANPHAYMEPRRTLLGPPPSPCHAPTPGTRCTPTPARRM